MPEHPTCIDCNAQAPDTNSSYTLISATFGWRLTRKVGEDGARSVEWRCPNCWRAHKGHAAPGGAAGVVTRAPGRELGHAAGDLSHDAKAPLSARQGTLTERILAKKS